MDEKIKQANEDLKTKNNSLSDLTAGISATVGQDTPMINKKDSIQLNNDYALIFNDRQLLNQTYVKHGIIQTLVDQPVDDGFATGIDLKSEQLGDDIKVLEQYLEKENVWWSITQCIKWARLFGGGGIVIMTDQKSDEQLDISRIKKDSPLDFYPADCWELNMQMYFNNPEAFLDDTENPYYFYGKNIHKSRVLKIKGKEAPSLARPRYRGWGMTELERLIRSFNQYIKNNNVIYELLDEAKIDVYGIQGFNEALMTSDGTAGVATRIQHANIVKSYLNALVMDTEDTYEQKKMTFAGLGQILQQIRIGIASDLKMPVTKLFGVSSAGFNSGEDDIENYNSMIRSEVRVKSKYIIIQILQLCSQKLFGFVPKDIDLEFRPLRILSASEEEDVKDKKFSRVMSSFASGILDPIQVKQQINQGDLLPIQVEENDEVFENQGVQNIEAPKKEE